MMRNAIVLLCLLIAACTNERGLVEPPLPELLGTPDTVTLNGTSFITSHMMVSPLLQGHIGVFGLLETTNGTVPAGVSTGRIWLIHDNVVWTAPTATDNRPLTGIPGAVEYFFAFGGPTDWPPDDSVDVVVEVRSGSGVTQRQRAPRQAIVITGVDPP